MNKKETTPVRFDCPNKAHELIQPYQDAYKNRKGEPITKANAYSNILVLAMDLIKAETERMEQEHDAFYDI